MKQSFWISEYRIYSLTEAYNWLIALIDMGEINTIFPTQRTGPVLVAFYVLVNKNTLQKTVFLASENIFSVVKFI